MGMPAARLGDSVTATDTHIVLVPAAAGATVPTPLPHPFTGTISSGVSNDVLIEGRPAAVAGSTAANQPPHIPNGPGSFQKPPTNQAVIQKGSATVFINGKPAARAGDTALTCNDPVDLPIGQIVGGAGTVQIG